MNLYALSLNHFIKKYNVAFFDAIKYIKRLIKEKGKI